MIDASIVREILTAVIELTRLRQNEVKHLCVENFAPELFAKMLVAYKEGPAFPPYFVDGTLTEEEARKLRTEWQKRYAA